MIRDSIIIKFMEVASKYFNDVFELINKIKKSHWNLWMTNDGYNEYCLKVDGYYFCKKKKKIMVVIRVRNKRTTDEITLNELTNNNDYLQELHPIDVFLIGVLANNERNGLVDHGITGWKKMIRLKDYRCFVKSDPILDITRKYFDKSGSEIIVLFSKLIEKEITISIRELCNNLALVCAIDGFQAISIGYDVSEAYIRENLLNGVE